MHGIETASSLWISSSPNFPGMCIYSTSPYFYYPYPYRGGGRGGQNQPVEFHFFLLGNPGIVIQPLEWNCKATFLNKPWALVRKYLRLAPPDKYDHGSAIFWRDAIPTYTSMCYHVLLQSDMCLAPPELSARI